MQGYGASTYGDAFADVYDDWYDDVSDVAATVALVREQVDAVDAAAPAAGAVLELGVGTGRLALPLAGAGLAVTGVDASEAMLARLRAKDPDSRVATVRGDMVDDLPAGPFAVALVAYNTLFNLVSAERQRACFAAVAARLVPGGRFVVEAFVPEPGATSQVSVRSIAADRLVLSASRHDHDRQTAEGHLVELTEAGGVRLRPWSIRWSTPAQLDEMAAAAGFALHARWGDVDRRPFEPDSDRHVSAYRLVAPGGGGL